MSLKQAARKIANYYLRVAYKGGENNATEILKAFRKIYAEAVLCKVKPIWRGQDEIVIVSNEKGNSANACGICGKPWEKEDFPEDPWIQGIMVCAICNEVFEHLTNCKKASAAEGVAL